VEGLTEDRVEPYLKPRANSQISLIGVLRVKPVQSFVQAAFFLE
jgi:hypothetical protein